MKNYLLLLFLAITGSTVNAQVQANSTKRYIKTTTGYLMVLRQGDDVLRRLKSWQMLKRFLPQT